MIANGGYGPGLIDATQEYIDVMLRLRAEPELERVALEELIADSLGDGSITWFAPYEAVHRENVDIVLGRADPL